MCTSQVSPNSIYRTFAIEIICAAVQNDCMGGASRKLLSMFCGTFWIRFGGVFCYRFWGTFCIRFYVLDFVADFRFHASGFVSNFVLKIGIDNLSAKEVTNFSSSSLSIPLKEKLQ